MMTCIGCGADTMPGDRFCEECGTDLLVTSAGSPDSATPPTALACVACGGATIDADGFCAACGHRQPAARDRVELDLAGVAGVSDRGLRHHRNEDAMALRVATSASGIPEHVVAVVCDGVSTSDRPDEAAKAAADAAADVLLAAARNGTDLVKATEQAVATALDAVIALGPREVTNAPACTLVSAVVGGRDIIIGWVGDSRAYWLGETGSERLTIDDSWAERMIAAGELDSATAFADPRSHALVAWLGADAGPVTAHVRVFTPPGPGVLLVCSDGLWNYVWEPDALAAAALPGALTEPIAAARALTRIALDDGGYDNITVVLVPRQHPDTDSSTDENAKFEEHSP